MAGQCILVDAFGDVRSKDHRKIFVALRDDARTALEYTRLYRTGPSAEIRSGEDIFREFKSTLRWNIKAGRNDEAITHSALKTIAAFANSNGRTLFIGVDDMQRPTGLQLDGFPDIDKFGLHLNNLVNGSMGANVAAALQITYPVVDGKQICRIGVPRIPSPRSI